MKKTDTNLVATQANVLIKGTNTCTALQRDLFLFALSQIPLVEDENGKYTPVVEKDCEFEIDGAECCKALGLSYSDRNNAIRKAARSIQSKIITVDRNGHEYDINIFHYFRYPKAIDGSSTSSKIKFQFHEMIIKDISNLKSRMTTLEIANAINLKSVHSKAIYSLCKLYQGESYRYDKEKDIHSVTMSIDEIRKLLGLNLDTLDSRGRPPKDGKPKKEKYATWRSLRQSVLKPSLAEINAITDIEVDLVTKRVSLQPITEFTFEIKQVNKKTQLIEARSKSKNKEKEKSDISSSTEPNNSPQLKTKLPNLISVTRANIFTVLDGVKIAISHGEVMSDEYKKALRIAIENTLKENYKVIEELAL